MNVWKAILAALVIFAAGVVTGGMTVSLAEKTAQPAAQPSGTRTNFANAGGPNWTPDRMDRQHRELMRRMENALDLSTEQHDHISQLVEDSRERLSKFSHEAVAHTRGEMEQLRASIRKELKPEQQDRFEEVFRPRMPLWTQQRQGWNGSNSRPGVMGNADLRKPQKRFGSNSPEKSLSVPEPPQGKDATPPADQAPADPGKTPQR
ncbi:MAG TPA: hypothetical protein VHH73_17145 [Verrucomicrobiae bacterium]|nr:hypothetical protein [Verrucomicrobiae bacterium]